MQSISPAIVLLIIVIYFVVLIIISRITGKDSGNENFFLAKRSSPWYVVAFGMIGASLSGVTFISVPGWVEASQFSYMQMVIGYFFGYLVIAFVLMPMYYRLRLTSIYTYLEERFGKHSYKTGAAFFLLSRTIGASFRLFLVAIVLQRFLMDAFGIPFWVTVLITIILIWIYTHRGGIRTIIWTDTLQTAAMLIAVTATVIYIGNDLGLSISEIAGEVRRSDYSRIWFFEGGWADPNNFFKQFIAGAFMAIVMTGLDQDMMQKNLSCPSIKDAQKNMLSFSAVLIFANLLFLSLGALLFIYSAQHGIEMPTRLVGGEMKEASDLLYPTIALRHLSPAIGIVFLIGLIAAAYSSADSALTSLTTSFCIDFLNFDKRDESEQQKQLIRRKVHILFSFVLFVFIMTFWMINDDAVIKSLFKAAGYTYGPLLGLYAYGFYIKRKVVDKFVPFICILAPILSFVLEINSETLFWGYKFGFEVLLINGFLTMVGLYLSSLFELKAKS